MYVNEPLTISARKAWIFWSKLNAMEMHAVGVVAEARACD
jgi:hypothetical protein